jgi:hypothetical protein
MLTVLILVVFAAVVLVLVLLVVVVIAIRQEPRDTELDNVAPSLIAVMVRRLLGVYLRRPAPLADRTDCQRGMVAGHATRHCTKPSAKREEVRNHCRHTPLSK